MIILLESSCNYLPITLQTEQENLNLILVNLETSRAISVPPALFLTQLGIEFHAPIANALAPNKLPDSAIESKLLCCNTNGVRRRIIASNFMNGRLCNNVQC